MFFLEGDTAKLFKELAITIIGAVFFSTIISLTLTPMLCSKFVTAKKNKKRNIENFYIKTLEFSLKRDILVILLVIIIISSIFYLIKNIPRELSPREDRGAFFMVMESPEGSTFENTVEQMLKLEDKLMQFNNKNEANRILRVPRSFSGTENFSDGIGIIVLNHWDDRRSIWKIIEEIKKISTEITDSKDHYFSLQGVWGKEGLALSYSL